MDTAGKSNARFICILMKWLRSGLDSEITKRLPKNVSGNYYRKFKKNCFFFNPLMRSASVNDLNSLFVRRPSAPSACLLS